MGRPERVADFCSRLQQQISHPPTAAEAAQLEELIPLLSLKGGDLAAPLFDLLARVASVCGAPWPFLAGMLAARDPELGRRALHLTAQLAESGMIPIDEEKALFLARQVESEGSLFRESTSLRTIGQLVSRLPAAGAAHPVLDLYRRAPPDPLSRLAARLLDLDNQPASSRLARELLGRDAYSFLHPYLDYTRASHFDLLHLVPERGQPPPALPSLRRTETTCGAELLREVIAALGWHRINLGLEVTPTIGVSIGDSIPFLVSPAEAQLIASCTGARRVSESFIFIAHGGLPVDQPGDHEQGSTVARFRAYNLAHAEVLADILDVAALTGEKTRRILSRMDEIVSDFTALFAAMSEECEILPAVYAELRQRVTTELEKEDVHPQLSPELTRLVQMFEDPGSLADVRTLHGLKRYLHQRGLKLGLRLVAAGAGTMRTVSLVVSNRRRILRTVAAIQYVDFEPTTPQFSAGPETASTVGLPFPVSVLVHAYGTQLLHGQESFPSIKIFCYGNEVHYYIAFKNHPAFLRIDFSPPLKGGMIDLEYFGVSNYELSAHPNPALDSIRLFFGRLDFDVQIDGTRIHARYDKERALDLGELCDAAGALCRLIPFLMDVDWIIGGLDLDRDARARVARAWADRFALSGTLPIEQLLTRDRRGILQAVETGPAGEREVPWSGEGSYRDRLHLPSADLLLPLHSALEELGLDIVSFPTPGESQGVGAMALERLLLRPLREAVARGELMVTPDGFRKCPPQRFQRKHEAEALAEILGRDDTTIREAALLGQLVAPLERTLSFQTTGSVNGYEVQRARLPLLGESLGLHVLRDAGGIVRLAVFTHGESIYKRRDDPNDTWRSNESLSVPELTLLLRRSNYLAPGVESPGEWEAEEAERIREMFGRTSPFEPRAPLRGESVLRGLRASPGRAVGRVLFSTVGRLPADFDGAVLVAASVRPEDSIVLHHAAGIVSTGGGILSHAGLIAVQLHKPALIISGQWRDEADGTRSLLHGTFEYTEEAREMGGHRVVLWHGMKEREHRLHEGALVVVDADAGTLRVIGHDREALALHEELRLFAAASRHLLHATDENEILRLRGRQLQARYQIAKLLGRLNDPIVARHAVHEILLGEAFEPAGARAHRAQLLSLVLGNPRVGPAARDGLLQIARELDRRRAAAHEAAERCIPAAESVFEILWLRLAVRRLHRILEGTTTALLECGLDAPPPDSFLPSAIDQMAARRLADLRLERLHALSDAAVGSRQRVRRRHLLREIGRLDLLLGRQGQQDRAASADELSRSDAQACARLAKQHILGPEEGGLELHPLLGWKAANLAEIGELGGLAHVPPWFAITRRAFNEVLARPLDQTAPASPEILRTSPTLGVAIDAILDRADLSPGQQSAQIRELWDRVALPRELIAELLAAYRRLGELLARSEDAPPDPVGPYVAIRSSSLEEDTESAARAGEFDTFLFVRGEDRLLDPPQTGMERAVDGTGDPQPRDARHGLGPDRRRGHRPAHRPLARFWSARRQ